MKKSKALFVSLFPLCFILLLISDASKPTQKAYVEVWPTVVLCSAPIEAADAKCVGSSNCRACKTCEYCAHCNSGGSCGVCSGSRSQYHVNDLFPPAAAKPARTQTYHTKPEPVKTPEPTTAKVLPYERIENRSRSSESEGITAANTDASTLQVTKETSLRAKATHESGVVLRLKPGQTVQLLEKTNTHWWKVRCKNEVGWVKAALLE